MPLPCYDRACLLVHSSGVPCGHQVYHATIGRVYSSIVVVSLVGTRSARRGCSVYFSDLGFISLILALCFAIYTIVMAVLGAVRNMPPLVASAKRSVLA